MSVPLLHRRLCVLMGIAALTAFAGGAGLRAPSTVLAAAGLVVALVRQPGPRLAALLERLWVPLAALLVLRVVLYVTVLGGDVVLAVVDLLLLLLCAEAFRTPDVLNDGRLHALSFALLLAATAYRPGPLFAVAFTGYVVAGTLALVVGHLRRSARAHGVAPARPGRGLLGLTGLLSLGVLGVSALVFVTFPRVGRAGPGRGDLPTTPMAGFADRVSLGEHGATIQANPEVVLRVEFPDGPPRDLAGLRWRGRSYDRFDGVRWSRSRGIRPAAAPRAWYRAWGDSVVAQRIWATPLETRVLFALHPILEVEAGPGIQPLFDDVGDHLYWGRAAPVYTVRSMASRPPVDSLRRERPGLLPDPSRFLQLPDLPDRVHALADSLTRGRATRYDRAAAVERWLRTEFRYTRDLPRTRREATLEHFLFQRRAGHCEYFSTAMVVLLRSAGIQARNVNGFLGGRWNGLGDYLVVSQNEAHSWVEVWFPGVGWVDFDPTPSGSGEAGGGGSWLWPWRLGVDALQHRWGRWVLDYSATSQSTLLERLLDSTGDGPRPSAGGEAEGGPLRWIVGLLVVAAGAVALRLLPSPAATLREESRIYRDLVRSVRRRGWAPKRPVTPEALVRALERAGHPAASPVGAVVDRYLRARFGGEPLASGEARTLRARVAEADRRLRDHPPPDS